MVDLPFLLRGIETAFSVKEMIARLLPVPFLILSACSLLATDWYVAPQGNDAWSGTLAAANAGRSDGPFATLARAREAVRKSKATGAAQTVQLRAGTYEVRETFKLEAQDSGSATAPVIWQAYEREPVVLIGGRAVGGWKPWKGGILQADLKAQGFRDPAFRQLFFAGQRQILARYPNFDPQNPYGGGWAYAAGEMWPMYAEIEGENKHTLAVRPEDWRTWGRPEEVEVFVFARYNWWNNIVRIKSVDAAQKKITTAKDASYAMRANDRYYFQGALEELDAPGEWHLDRQTATLYFRPPAAIDSAPVFVPTTRDILRLEGTEYLTLRGLTFECADGTAVVLDRARNCRVVACTVRDVGDYSGSGISVNGNDNGVIGCDIWGTGGNGVTLSGGDRPTLTAAGNFVENCYIHHVGIFHKQGAAVVLNGVGQRVSHCLIHDTPRFAIMYGGNNHILEYNHLRHLALETEDVGATYSGGRDWLSPRGTVIRYNFIHDVLGFGWNGKWTSPYFAWGIYLDDNSGGVDVIGNIVARCGRSLIHGHSARDCRVENNVFVEGGLRQWEFNGWTTKHRFWEQHLPTIEAGYDSVVNLPAWRGMRGMAVRPRDVPDSEGRVMSGNVFTRNIMAWKNPDSRALNVTAFNGERNDFDRNLYWHHGLPLLTGQRKAGAPIGGNLAPNADFAEGELGKLPKDWNWQVRGRADATAAIVEDGGVRVLRIGAGLDREKKNDNYPIVASRDIELKPGGAYRLHAKMRSNREGNTAGLKVQFYVGPKDGNRGAFWSSTPADAKLTTAWQDFEFAFSIPARGERGYDERMKNFRIRLNWPAAEGALFFREVRLEETQALDEWKSWQELGGDRHSVIADPKFVAPEKDDYRLQPDSPAFQLGFKPIPMEKIGPYASDERASWPIVEAEGARERPVAGK
jgi:hypothetical protein